MAIDWAVENLRVSLFSDQAVEVSDSDWRNLTGQEESETRKAVPGGRVFSGPFDDVILSFAGTANRIDIVMSCAPESSTELPVIGPWDTTREKFVLLTTKWIKSVSFPVIRIAFGAVLLSPTPGKREAYVLLQRMLTSITIDPDEMRELVYRINWPTQSRVINGMAINRITQWNPIRMLVKALQSGDLQLNTKIAELNALRLELDDNTDEARTDKIDREKIIPVYNELIELAIQNAARGERP